jgi:protein-S-isoprenylcysteine O-methyltransferase Ste14
MVKDAPLLTVTLTVCTYWCTVAALAVAKRMRHGYGAGLVPRHAHERRLWFLFVPVVAAWIALPVLASQGRLPATEAPWPDGLRWAAAGVAVGCFVLSLYCWALMGRNWSMAVVPDQTTRLVTAGPYRWVRHPIYSLSIVLMLATVAVLSVAPMILVAALHLLALNLKAAHEERHLAGRFGPDYARYRRAAGRFWPRLRQISE